MIFVSHIVDVAAIKTQTDKLNFTGDFVESIPGNAGVLNDLSAAQVNAEVYSALNTAIPGSPTVDSLNELIKRTNWLRELETYNYTIGDDLIFSNDLEGTQPTVVLTKVKDINITISETIRIKFDIKLQSAGATAYGRIYKNGALFGTSQTNVTAVYETFSEDLLFAKGDTLELWAWTTNATYPCMYRNLRIYGLKSMIFENVLE